MKTVFGVLDFLSFFYLLGVVGGVERDTISLGAGAVHMIIALGCFHLFARLSGAYDPIYTPPKKKSRPRERDSRRRQAKSLNDKYNTENQKKKGVSQCLM